jgi:acyl-CoA thioesterase
MTTFDETAALTPAGPNRWTAELAPDWAQGRTTFGGLVAALTTTAAAEVSGPGRPLRSIDVAFVAPLAAGPVTIETEVLGEGRTVTQLDVSVRQGGVLGTRAYVVAGASRESAIRVPAAPAALDGFADPATAGFEVPFLDGLTPTFTQHIEARWCTPDVPFSGAGPEGAVVRGWCRHRTPASGLPAVIGLLDSWPPSVLPMAPGPAPASTVRWSAHVVGPLPPAGGSEWYWYEAETVHSADGYATARAALYAERRLVLWSEQLIAVYDRPAEGVS